MATSKYRNQRKPQAPQEVCIFCQSTGMTKQHLWPDWMGRDASMPTYRTAGVHSNNRLLTGFSSVVGMHTKQMAVAPVLPQVKEHKRHIGSLRLRKVCTSCNNTWMSKIEQDSQEIIKALVLNADIMLTASAQIKLVPWVAQMTIVNEFDDLPNKVIPYGERKYYMENKLPPLGWRIFIGRYEGSKYVQDYHHKGIAAGYTEDRTFNWQKRRGLNFQASRFIAGGLLLYIISGTAPEIQEKIKAFSHPKLVQLWPSLGEDINWATMPLISTAEADALGNNSRNIVVDYENPSSMPLLA